jgi:hypothetical protein
MYVGCWKCGKPIGSEGHFEIERTKGHFYDVCEECYKKWKLRKEKQQEQKEKGCGKVISSDEGTCNYCGEFIKCEECREKGEGQ